MAFLDTQIKRVKRLRSELEDIMFKVLVENEDAIIDMFQENQIGLGLMIGTRKDLIYIRHKKSRRTGYSRFTEDYWKRSSHYRADFDKSENNPYYMQWTGDFFESMRVYYEKKFKFGIRSTDPKRGVLFRDFGDILSLGNVTQKQIEKYILNDQIDSELKKRILSF